MVYRKPDTPAMSSHNWTWQFAEGISPAIGCLATGMCMCKDHNLNDSFRLTHGIQPSHARTHTQTHIYIYIYTFLYTYRYTTSKYPASTWDAMPVACQLLLGPGQECRQRHLPGHLAIRHQTLATSNPHKPTLSMSI